MRSAFKSLAAVIAGFIVASIIMLTLFAGPQQQCTGDQMPYLNVKLSGVASDETSSQVVEKLTYLTGELLHKKKELTSVAVEFLSRDAWFIGGRSLTSRSEQSFFLEIKVTEGTNTKDEKAQFVAQTFQAIEGIVGALASASYIVIHEVPADAWGYQGQTQEYRYIQGKSL